MWSVVYVSMTVLVINGVCGIRKHGSVWWLMLSVEYISMLVFDVVCCKREHIGV